MSSQLLALSMLLAGPAADPFPYAKAEAELSEDIGIDELKAHVHRLASPELLGRRGPGAARASRHIAELFARMKLKPAFDGSYYQPIPWLLADDTTKADSFVGRNVAAVLPGSDPKRKDEWIVLSAHFDHLGKSGKDLYAGADDNASGVALLLEVAERFALQKHRPGRTIVFVAFDLEEAGLQGSTHFATHPPRPLKDLKAFLTVDMVGRSMADVMDEYVFALGCETAPQLRELLEKESPGKGLKVGRLGTDIIGTRSDYGPFRDRRVPFLFFSTGQHPDYHRPSDTPDKIDYAKLRRISLYVHRLTEQLADTDRPPVWNAKEADPDLDEVRTIHAILARVLDRPKQYPLSKEQNLLAVTARDRLATILGRGKFSASERAWLVWTARLMLSTLF